MADRDPAVQAVLDRMRAHDARRSLPYDQNSIEDCQHAIVDVKLHASPPRDLFDILLQAERIAAIEAHIEGLRAALSSDERIP